MKKIGAIATIACVVASLSAAASAETRFRGSFTLTRVKDCLARYVGETFNSAFRPAGIGGNPNITSLSQLNQYSGDVYELVGAGFVADEWIVLKGYGIDNLHYEFDARLRLATLSPRRITPTTNFLIMAGTIENMGNDPGIGTKECVASFRGAYFRRIE